MSPRYYYYYLKGLVSIYGAVQWSASGFPDLRDPKQGMAVILPAGQRIFVAGNDHAFVDPSFIAWADVVGQVNVDPTVNNSSKVVPIGPSFGIPWHSNIGLAKFILRSGFGTSPRRIPAMMRDYLGQQAHRSPLDAYVPGTSRDDYIFYVATYWRNAPGANSRRLRFLEAAAMRRDIELEGGFWSADSMPEEYRQFRLSAPVDHHEYLRKVKLSSVVFNTPAVHDCLGWKLGEFLALGKAILSTDLGRVMPGEFRSGEQYHLIQDDREDTISDALDEVLGDSAYRAHLERAARQYWEDFLSPEAVMKRLFSALEAGPAKVGD